MLATFRQRFHRNNSPPVLIQNETKYHTSNKVTRDDLSCQQCGVLTHKLVSIRFRKRKVPLNNEFVHDGVCQICIERIEIGTTRDQSKDDEWSSYGCSQSMVSDLTMNREATHQDDLSLLYSCASMNTDENRSVWTYNFTKKLDKSKQGNMINTTEESDNYSLWSYNTFGRTNDAGLDDYFDHESVATSQSKAHIQSLITNMDNLPTPDTVPFSDESSGSDDALLFDLEAKSVTSSCNTPCTNEGTRDTFDETYCSSSSSSTLTSPVKYIENYNNKKLSPSCASLKKSFHSDQEPITTKSNKTERKRVQFSDILAATPDQVRHRVRSMLAVKSPVSCMNSSFHTDEVDEVIEFNVNKLLNEIQSLSNVLEISEVMVRNASYPLIIESAYTRIREVANLAENEVISCYERISTAKNIVSTMASQKITKDVNEQACLTIAFLCKRENWRQMFEGNFCAAALLCSLNLHADIEAVVSPALDILICLTSRNVLLVKSIARQRGVRLILKVLRHHHHNSFVVEQCSQLLHTLSNDNLSLQDLSVAYDLMTLHIALKEHMNSIRIVETLLIVLCRVTITGVSLDKALVESILHSSLRHEQYASIQILICKVLCNLALSSYQNILVIAQCGGLQTLQRMIHMFDSVTVHEEVISCFYALSMTRDDYLKRQLAKSDVIDSILFVVDAHPLNEYIQSNGLTTIEALCGFVDYSIQVYPVDYNS